jgi:hypothetical protein
MDREALLIRGTTVDAARRFLDQHRSHPQWDAFMAALTEEQRYLMAGNIKPKGWYVVAEYASVVQLAALHLAPENKEPFLVDLGRFVMEDGVNSLYKIFFRIASPAFVVRVSALFWFQFYKGSRLKIVGKGKRWVHGVILDAPYCAIDLCHSTKGAMIAALEHAGAKAVQVEEHTCQSTGAERCNFRFSWR